MHLTPVAEGSSLSIIVILSDVANVRNIREELIYQLSILPVP